MIVSAKSQKSLKCDAVNKLWCNRWYDFLPKYFVATFPTGLVTIPFISQQFFLTVPTSVIIGKTKRYLASRLLIIYGSSDRPFMTPSFPKLTLPTMIWHHTFAYYIALLNGLFPTTTSATSLLSCR